MPKKEIIKPKKKVEPVDFFYQSKYTANNVNDFMEIWQNVHNRIACLNCNIEPVEIKKNIVDKTVPTFGILRKQFCFKCWLNMVKI
jgi:hypothetical protein